MASGRVARAALACAAGLVVGAAIPAAPSGATDGAAGRSTAQHRGAGTPVLRFSGRSWRATDGAMAGVAPGRPGNVTVDARGYLHLRIKRSAAGTTAAELFSTGLIGFGTFQWVVRGPVFSMDAPTVLGLFTYGPEAGVGRDGEDEIDVEFSRWNATLCGGRCNADFTVYPATGRVALGPTEHDYAVAPVGHFLVTARVSWTPTSITETLMNGAQPISRTADVLQSWRDAPRDPAARIPQHALPVGINLWCSERPSPTSQEVVVESFSYVARTAA